MPIAILALFITTSVSAAAPQAQKQHFVFISDTQYPWTEKSDSGEPEDSADLKQRSADFIFHQAGSVFTYRNDHGGLENVPMFINGDLTAYGHGWQRRFIRSTPWKDLWKKNFYVNLGNHDYQNNVGNCANNGCARDMINDMRADLAGYRTILADPDSMAYMIESGGIYAIQLQNEPTYTTSFTSSGKRYEIKSSMAFLERALGLAHANGRDVILNMHKAPYDNWTVPRDPHFVRLMEQHEHRILGIFAGHLHRKIGKTSQVGAIPVYLSGASHYATWLTADYDRSTRTLTVQKVEGNDWKNRSTVVGARSGRDAPAVSPAEAVD